MSGRNLVCLFIAAVAWLGAGSAVAATPLQFELVEDDQGVTLQVRGLDADDADRKVVTSKGGYLLFFDGYEAKAQRLKPSQKHRLGFAQIGQSKDRVALRIAQTSRSKGALSTFVESIPVDGGIDLRIADGEAVAAASEDEGAAVIAEPAESRSDRAATLAALEGSLAADAAPALGDGPPPILPPGGSQAAADATPAEPGAQDERAEATSLADAPLDAGERDVSAGLDTADGPPSSAGLLRGAVALLFLIGTAAGVALWMRRRAAVGSGSALEVISRVGIGPKQSILWIRAGSRELLLGATEKRIEVLAELGGGEQQPHAAPSPAPGSITGAANAAARIDAAPPPVSDPAPARIAAFKARLEQALGGELSGAGPLELGDDMDVPAHLRLLARDPRWTESEKGVA